MVDFQVRSRDQVLFFPRRAADVVVEDVREGPRDDAHLLGVVPQPLHRERLPGSGLAVREDGSVEAFEDGVDQRGERLFVEVALLRVPVVHEVEGEGLRGIGGSALRVADLNLKQMNDQLGSSGLK